MIGAPPHMVERVWLLGAVASEDKDAALGMIRMIPSEHRDELLALAAGLLHEYGIPLPPPAAAAFRASRAGSRPSPTRPGGTDETTLTAEHPTPRKEHTMPDPIAVTLSGHSDDLIEIDGGLSEEFAYHEEEWVGERGDLVAFSDGTILRIVFSDAGVWRITPVTRGLATLRIDTAAEDDGGTDVATLTGDIRWAVHGDAYVVTR